MDADRELHRDIALLREMLAQIDGEARSAAGLTL
jgi:hypothetical protein